MVVAQSGMDSRAEKSTSVREYRLFGITVSFVDIVSTRRGRTHPQPSHRFSIDVSVTHLIADLLESCAVAATLLGPNLQPTFNMPRRPGSRPMLLRWRRRVTMWWSLVIVACCCFLAESVSAGNPIATVTRLRNLPAKLFYFDDTSTILMFDPYASNVHVSPDEGKSWSLAEGIPEGEAVRLVEHPFNNEMAFVLGREKQHWVTYNRGQSWQEWQADLDASLMGEVLSFHAGQPDWILYQGVECSRRGGGWWGKTCHDTTMYTLDAFRTPPIPLLAQTSSCLWARSSKAFLEAPEKLVYCIAFDASHKDGGMHSLRESRLYSSEDFFQKERKFVDLGIGKKAQGVVGLGVVSKFMVVAMRAYEGLDRRSAAAAAAAGAGGGSGGGDPMHLYVSTDGTSWKMARFPHSAMPSLRENAFTIVESTTHSLAVDVLTEPDSNIGTLFVSSGDGIYFVEALADTNRNDAGIVDYEGLTGLEGVAIANTVRNREGVVGWGEEKRLQTVMTYDDGSLWSYLKPPAKKLNGDDWPCDVSDSAKCSLHLHSVSRPHNFGKIFSSSAPGFVMGVGNVGESLGEYDEGDTFISSDAGLTWRMAREGAHKYEFGDQGSIIVMVSDEDKPDHVLYSYDFGVTWEKLDLGVSIQPLVLTTVPDSTSQKFILLGTLGRRDGNSEGRHAAIQLDFAPLQTRKCGEKDMERWYARSGDGHDCLLGHKQWYKRRKPDATCYVGNKFNEEVGHEESCECRDQDYECDFNYVLSDGECVMKGLEAVPAGSCINPGDTYLGSSGYRKIPGDTCQGGIQKEKQIRKDCSLARPEDGQPSHVVHEFSSPIIQQYYFPKSQTTLLQLADNSVWQSSNEGFSWKRLYERETILNVMLHAFAPERAYLITDTRKIYFTTDAGKNWDTLTAPADPNGLSLPILDFHPTRPDWLIFTGSIDCSSTLSSSCRAVAYYTTDNGYRWKEIEQYVRNCAWARDARLKIDEREILCESYKTKKGSQRSWDYNPMELIAGRNYYSDKIKLFDSVVGFATFSEYLIVAEYIESAGVLKLQVSLDGYHFAEGQFPPSMRIENRAYTVLESNTDSVFLHVTMSSEDGNEWGSIFKSNSNGTYYSLAVEHVNRDARGYTDFEKMLGLDGIAVINIVSNYDTAGISGQKKLRTLITHNDGANWRPMTPPSRDSLGQPYDCTSTSCSLHIHGYTERRDPRATYSSPSAVGLMLAVGNVGETLAAYEDSDIFLTRDGGFTWEEVHKDAHMWEYGDSGSIIVLANDEGPVDHIIYSKDEGLTWNSYSFEQRIRIRSIHTVPEDTSRKFVLVGNRPGEGDKSVLVYLDLSTVSNRKCVLSTDDPQNDDIELWSPAESRSETCLFGRQTVYHRRIRDRDCYIGELLDHPKEILRNCTCTAKDFECEFNHYKSESGECVLVDGAQALSTLSTEQEQCVGGAEFWYERTNVRKIPYSTCEGGDRPDRGAQHVCVNTASASRHGFFWWLLVLLIPFVLAGAFAWWLWQNKERGQIRLSEHRAFGGATGPLSTLASVPYFLVGIGAASIAWVSDKVPFLQDLFQGRRSRYSTVPIDEDAEILNGYEDE